MADWMLLLLPLLGVPIVLLFRFVGCSSFGTGEAFAFGLILESSEVTLTQGTSKPLKVTVTATGAFANDTTLAMSPLAGVTGVFSPNPVNPHTDNIDSLLMLSAAPAAAAGTSIVTITGTAPGAAPPKMLTVNQSLTIKVVAPPVPVSDFSLSLTPPSRTVASGATATFTVNINRVGGFAEPLTLTVSPAGPGTFAPNPATGAASTLTAPTAGAPAGTYTFTVTGTGTSGAMRSATGTLILT